MHRVTVGMPVRNGARHIAQAIDSFLHQTFSDFGLVVYDNASTDDTAGIVTGIASRDSRVTLVRHERDIGGARNFILAAERASSPLFCWAAHDDRREPDFLRTMADLLDANPNAGLACCAVRNIDPDGTPREVRPETASLRTTNGLSPAQRLRMYLRDIPGTPFYGLFRTHALHEAMPTLHELDGLANGGPALLGIDMLFLARFMRDHGLAVSRAPLVLFRRGGISHNLGRYGSLREFHRQLRVYRREMRRATTPPDVSLTESIRLRACRSASFWRWMLSRDMRRMTAHYLTLAAPGVDRVRTAVSSHFNPALRRLRFRLSRGTTEPSSIVLFGAGKHTRRCWRTMQRAIGRTHAIIACCDDRADACEPIDGLRIVPPSALAELKPDVLLVSSDTYEHAMFDRARLVAPRTTKVWTLYDTSLEAAAGSSTAATNDESSESASAVSSAPAS